MMRILVVADVHANLAAFRAVLADAGAVDAIWGLGDLVGYGPDPCECVELADDLGAVLVAGNHDLAAVGRLETTDFSGSARRGVDYARRRLSARAKAVLSNLPLQRDAGSFRLVHASPADPVWTYIFGPVEAAEGFAANPLPHALFGHSHVPCRFGAPGVPAPPSSAVSSAYGVPGASVSLTAGRWLLNPGSVGYPRDAADAHRSGREAAAVARYGLVDDSSGTWEFRRVVYDRRAVRDRERNAGLGSAID